MFVSLEVIIIIVTGVTISWLLCLIINHLSSLAAMTVCLINAIAGHDSLLLMVSQLSYNGLIHKSHLNLEIECFHITNPVLLQCELQHQFENIKKKHKKGKHL